MKSTLMRLRPVVLVCLIALLVSPLLSAIVQSAGPERRAQDVEDCVACRYIWLQVEMVSGRGDRGR